jgi:hypothetical protein
MAACWTQLLFIITASYQSNHELSLIKLQLFMNFSVCSAQSPALVSFTTAQVARFNHSHRISDIRRFIRASRPNENVSVCFCVCACARVCDVNSVRALFTSNRSCICTVGQIIYRHCIRPYIWWVPCQKYRVYTVYIRFWPTLRICPCTLCARQK